jgi:hypothetical protein
MSQIFDELSNLSRPEWRFIACCQDELEGLRLLESRSPAMDAESSLHNSPSAVDVVIPARAQAVVYVVYQSNCFLKPVLVRFVQKS